MEIDVLQMLEGYEGLAFKVVVSVVVFVLAKFFVKYIKPAVKGFDKRVETIELSEHNLVLISQVIKYLTYIVALAVVLTIFGMTEALYTLLTGGAILGFGVGYASKDIISNMLSGIIVAIDKPFKIGDDVEVGGIRGTVKVIAFRTTRLQTPEDVLVEVPNSLITSKPIKNYTRK